MTPAHPAPECALVNGRRLNVLTGELTATNVAVGGGIVLGVGDRYRQAPQLTGDGLEHYLSAGIESDHECVSLAEARPGRSA